MDSKLDDRLKQVYVRSYDPIVSISETAAQSEMEAQAFVHKF
jgi:hypothetical protein